METFLHYYSPGRSSISHSIKQINHHFLKLSPDFEYKLPTMYRISAANNTIIKHLFRH